MRRFSNRLPFKRLLVQRVPDKPFRPELDFRVSITVDLAGQYRRCLWRHMCLNVVAHMASMSLRQIYHRLKRKCSNSWCSGRHSSRKPNRQLCEPSQAHSRLVLFIRKTISPQELGAGGGETASQHGSYG